MFGSSEKKNQALPAVRPTSSIECLIGEKMAVDGNVTFSGGLHIDGTVRGAVVAEGADALLVLGDKGRIEGEIRAPHVVLKGELIGDVVASAKLELGPSARVRGNIYYKVLEMAAGAQVNGQILHEDEPRKSLPKPEVAVEAA